MSRLKLDVVTRQDLKDISERLWKLFSWRDSPQGFKYWLTVTEELDSLSGISYCEKCGQVIPDKKEENND